MPEEKQKPLPETPSEAEAPPPVSTDDVDDIKDPLARQALLDSLKQAGLVKKK
ncbi:MAG: hypothetical protein ISR52_05125 [Rhodospirillales bacterium]|nr:hypothetical protein [Rhodospirillales bacterium]